LVLIGAQACDIVIPIVASRRLNFRGDVMRAGGSPGAFVRANFREDTPRGGENIAIHQKK